LLSAKNPTDWLSGDQKGNEGFSVPARDCAETEFNERSHRRDPVSVVASEYDLASVGEIASDAGLRVGGVLISTRVSGVGGVGRRARAVVEFQ
jgi:hypothetical protein